MKFVGTYLIEAEDLENLYESKSKMLDDSEKKKKNRRTSMLQATIILLIFCTDCRLNSSTFATSSNVNGGNMHLDWY